MTVCCHMNHQLLGMNDPLFGMNNELAVTYLLSSFFNLLHALCKRKVDETRDLLRV